ncbi:MAG: hypothetical protein LLF98_06390 [Clostridium sp.]|uniref:GP88 family protein n=1 Tax=Clostridium sp. TaxID=1506 RepID=UPI0025C38503|nr:hypothetical protein [Clostridium sp.]MCE5220894.1 hypothetical protein [Clostridium sp.]
MLKKSELNQNIHLSEGNIKSKCTDDVMFLTWSLPCKITCPYATKMCRKHCFAQKNQYFKTVLDSRMRNFEEAKKDTFVEDMINHLKYQLSRKKSQDKIIYVRIHTSGDFFNLDYFIKWINITNYFRNNKKILFQAYTKSIPIMNYYIQDYKTTYGYEFSDREILEDINIHFVWSIWEDTPKEYTDRAKELELQTFTAIPKKEIENVNNKIFICKGDCGNCKQCYVGKAKEIVIPIH